VQRCSDDRGTFATEFGINDVPRHEIASGTCQGDTPPVAIGNVEPYEAIAAEWRLDWGRFPLATAALVKGARRATTLATAVTRTPPTARGPDDGRGRRRRRRPRERTVDWI
jgi:hypothetical protein